MSFSHRTNRNWLILIIVATLWAWLNGVGGHVHGAEPPAAQQQVVPVLVDFTADWCPPCQQMKSILRQLQAAGYEVRVVDCTDRQKFENAKALYGFRTLPMFIAYSGQLEVTRHTGTATATDLVAMLAKANPAAANAGPNNLLIAEGRRIGAQSLRTGKNHPALQAMAQRHANYQASVGVQGHQAWENRENELHRTAPEARLCIEVAAESDAGQSANAAAAEMYNSWRQSPGHWQAVNSPCTYWGYAMAYSPVTRKWYAAGVLGHANYRVDGNGFRVPAQQQVVRKPVTKSNFVVSAADPAFAARVQAAAEQYRRDLAIEWIGQELPRWSNPCPIRVVADENLGAGGETKFQFEDGQVFDWRMTMQGSPERILDSVLPHEVLHTIFASHFRQPLPRWADEGACSTVEHPSEQTKHGTHLVEFLRTGRGLPFDKMLAMTEYPADVMPLYSQGYSVSDFLIQHNGKQGFVGFLEDMFAAGGDYRTALKANYDYATSAELQTAWLEWIRAGSPRAQHETAYRLGGLLPCPCHRWRPLKRLWEHRPGFIFPKFARQQGQQQPQPRQVAPSIAQNGNHALPPIVEPQVPYQQQPVPDPPLVDVPQSPPAASRPPEASSSPVDEGGRDTEAPLWRPGSKIAGAVKGGIDKIAPAAEGAIQKAGSSWLTGALVSFGIPGGIAAVGATAATWFLMRRGKKRLAGLNEQLQSKVRNFEQDARVRVGMSAAGESSSGGMLTISGDPVLVERNRNHVVELDHAITDAAWSRAHRIYMDYYPGTANALKAVEKLKNQILKGEPLDFQPRF